MEVPVLRNREARVTNEDLKKALESTSGPEELLKVLSLANKRLLRASYYSDISDTLAFLQPSLYSVVNTLLQEKSKSSAIQNEVAISQWLIVESMRVLASKRFSNQNASHLVRIKALCALYDTPPSISNSPSPYLKIVKDSPPGAELSLFRSHIHWSASNELSLRMLEHLATFYPDLYRAMAHASCTLPYYTVSLPVIATMVANGVLDFLSTPAANQPISSCQELPEIVALMFDSPFAFEELFSISMYIVHFLVCDKQQLTMLKLPLLVSKVQSRLKKILSKVNKISEFRNYAYKTVKPTTPESFDDANTNKLSLLSRITSSLNEQEATESIVSLMILLDEEEKQLPIGGGSSVPNGSPSHSYSGTTMSSSSLSLGLSGTLLNTGLNSSHSGLNLGSSPSTSSLALTSSNSSASSSPRGSSYGSSANPISASQPPASPGKSSHIGPEKSPRPRRSSPENTSISIRSGDRTGDSITRGPSGSGESLLPRPGESSPARSKLSRKRTDSPSRRKLTKNPSTGSSTSSTKDQSPALRTGWIWLKPHITSIIATLVSASKYENLSFLVPHIVESRLFVNTLLNLIDSYIRKVYSGIIDVNHAVRAIDRQHSSSLPPYANYIEYLRLNNSVAAERAISILVHAIKSDHNLLTRLLEHDILQAVSAHFEFITEDKLSLMEDLQTAVLDRIDDIYKFQLDAKKPEHQKYFVSLWNTCFSESGRKLTGSISKQWMLLGFTDEDPTKLLKNRLPIHFLVYANEHASERFESVLLERLLLRTDDYRVAQVLVELTDMIVSVTQACVVHVRVLPVVFSHPYFFEELFQECLFVFDAIWKLKAFTNTAENVKACLTQLKKSLFLHLSQDLTLQALVAHLQESITTSSKEEIMNFSTNTHPTYIKSVEGKYLAWKSAQEELARQEAIRKEEARLTAKRRGSQSRSDHGTINKGTRRKSAPRKPRAVSSSQGSNPALDASDSSAH